MNPKKIRQLIVLMFLCIVLAVTFVFVKRVSTKENTDEQSSETYSVIDIDKTMVTEIGITTTEGTTDLYKEGGEWKAVLDATKEIDSEKVEDFLQDVCFIESEFKLEEVSDLAEYGLITPVMQVTLQWEDNLYTIKLGDYNSVISSYYISINDEPTVYTTNWTVYNAMNKTEEDFETESTGESTEESLGVSETE